MIETGNILVNGNKVKDSYKVKENDNIEITELIEETDILPENIPLDIYYEDDDLIVVNKPSGMVVHPAPGNREGTLVNALLYHTKNLSTINTLIRPGIVHRIDADTSGLLLVAKNDRAHNILADAIAKKEVVREYIALVEGIIKEDTATIDAPIGRDVNNRKKMCVTSENSKEAITHFRVIERLNNATLIRCKLETVRTHQIRVHLNYIGHPIVNDPVYGKKKELDELNNTMKKINVGDKIKRKHEELENKINKYNKKLEEAVSLKRSNKEINIGALMSVFVGNEGITFMSGTNNLYKEFNPKYAFYRQHIEDSIKKHLEYVNFYGISLDMDKNGPYYGIYELKRGFNPEITELIGEFDYVINPFVYYAYKVALKGYKLLKKLKK